MTRSPVLPHPCRHCKRPIKGWTPATVRICRRCARYKQRCGVLPLVEGPRHVR